MMPTLLLPAALAALAALALPLLIHLARRSERIPTPFAALRWLRSRPRPRRRPRWEEWPLLLLRLLLLALLALWLARPALIGGDVRQAWQVAIPGIAPEHLPMDADDGAGPERRWLAPGFPPQDRPPTTAPVPFASLLRQLDAELPVGTPLTVLAPARLEGADAELPRLSRSVEWRVLPGAMPAASPGPVVPPSLSVRHDATHASTLRYLRAAAQAWHPPDAQAGDVFEAGTPAQPLPPRSRVLVWLASGTLPEAVADWIGEGGTALLAAEAGFAMPATAVPVWRDATGAPLLRAAAMGRGRVLQLARPLRPDALPQLLQADFPRRLRELLAPPPAPARVDARAHAPLPGAAAPSPPPRDLRPWLALLIAVLLLFERGLATAPRRRTST